MMRTAYYYEGGEQTTAPAVGCVYSQATNAHAHELSTELYTAIVHNLCKTEIRQ